MPEMKLKTKIFDLWYPHSLNRLAQCMGISVSQVCRVKQGKRHINEKFILGALKALPGESLEELQKAIAQAYLLSELLPSEKCRPTEGLYENTGPVA